MNNRDLDKIIRQKLQDIHPASSEQAWSLFEQRFEAEQDFESLADNMHFDTHVSKKSTEIKPTSPAQWPKLYHDLLIIERRQATVFKSKLVEIAAVLLFIYAFVSTPDVWNHKIESAPDVRPAQQIGPFAKVEEPNFEDTNSQKRNIKTKTQASTKVSNDSPYQIANANQLTHLDIEHQSFVDLTSSGQMDEGQMVNSDQVTNKEVSQATNFNNDFSDIAIIDEKGPRQNEHHNADDLTLTREEISVNENTTIDNIGISDGSLNSTLDNLTEGKTAFSIVEDDNEDVEQIPAIALGANSNEANPLQMKVISKLPKAYWNVGGWVSRDVNQINTPFDRIYQVDSYEKEALNYSAGASISRKQGRFELTSGIDYAKRTYQPKPYVEKYGTSDDFYFEKSLSKISYDIISVPLKLKYDIIKKDKWSSYFMIGAALNLIYNADYAIYESVIAGTPPAENFAPVENARLSRKFFNRGISGNSDSDIASIGAHSSSTSTFANNYFVGLNCGFGVEKKINNKLSIYIEPSYQRHAMSYKSGIGPNNDKIHTLSLQLGVKSMLL